MRNHLIQEVGRLAESDPSILVLTADLGYSVLDGFAARFPERFFNLGISEQNMSSVAAGLALEGHTVFTYSIGNFPVMRCLEQIRNNICYHDANVKIVAVGGGFVYGQAGMTHHATEDIAITRALPRMRIYSPADAQEAVAAVRAAVAEKGPCYIRLGRGGEPDIHPGIPEFSLTEPLELRAGSDIAVFATGSVAGETVAAADRLARDGRSMAVYSIVQLKPFDGDAFRKVASRYRRIYSVEEHNVHGGFGSILAEALSEMEGPRPSLCRLGLQDVFTSVVGSSAYLRGYYGISAARIAERVATDFNRGVLG